VALRTERAVSPVLSVVAPFIPVYGPAILAALTVADPIIAKVAAAAPSVGDGIEAARPAIDAAQKVAPEVLKHVKEVLATAINLDPDQPDRTLPGAGFDVSEGEIEAFAGRMLRDTPLAALFKASLFTPQDARFDRQTPHY
jgi:hypothetical protein